MTNTTKVSPLTIVLAVALAAAIALLGFVALRSEPTPTAEPAPVAATPKDKSEPKPAPKATPTPTPTVTVTPHAEPLDEDVYGDDEDLDEDLEYGDDDPGADNLNLTWDEATYVVSIEDYFAEDVSADDEEMLVELGYLLCIDLEDGRPTEDIVQEGVDSGEFSWDEAAYIVQSAGYFLCPAYADAASLGA